MHAAAEVADAQTEFERRFPGRFLLGLGIGHAALVDDGHPGRYARPLATMRAYLDALDAAGSAERPRVLAALAPKMIELAAERASGVHPYLVPVAHTRLVRNAIGPEALIAQELSVVLGDDVDECRGRARRDLAGYLELPNYTRTWLRLGFAESDLASGGSDRLVDSLYGLGTPDLIAGRIAEYRDAGADHVCLRVVVEDPLGSEEPPVEAWAELGGLAAA